MAQAYEGNPFTPLSGAASTPRMAPWLTGTWSLLCWGTVQEAHRAVPTLVQLPPTCREALVHATMACTGGAPTYYCAGWGPWCSSWGWFGLGMALGALAAGVILLFGLPHQHVAPPATPPSPWHSRGARPGVRSRRTCRVTGPRDASGRPGRRVALPFTAGSTSDRTAPATTGSPHTPKHCARCGTAPASTPASAHLRPRKRASATDTRRGRTPDWDNNLRLARGTMQAHALARHGCQSTDSHSCVPMPRRSQPFRFPPACPVPRPWPRHPSPWHAASAPDGRPQIVTGAAVGRAMQSLACKARCTGTTGRAPLSHPTLGRRIGEAAHPGPARADRARAPEPHDETSRRRSRALHALAQMRLLLERAAHDSGAETLSDTLSAPTAVASPRLSYSVLQPRPRRPA